MNQRSPIKLDIFNKTLTDDFNSHFKNLVEHEHSVLAQFLPKDTVLDIINENYNKAEFLTQSKVSLFDFKNLMTKMIDKHLVDHKIIEQIYTQFT